jgi:multiple sugar transport system permease protein
LGRVAGIWILLVRMAPPVGFALPFYIILRSLKLLDTYPGLVIVYLTRTLPFVTWMMVGFIRNVPVALEESARIDGCTRIGTLFRITVPLSVPGLVTCAIFTTIMSWNEFFYALIISSRRTFTAPLVLRGYVGDTDVLWGALAAGSLLVAVPVIVFGVLMRKGMIRGLASGALK